MNNTYQIYLISDSTGETLDRIFLALKAQFVNIDYNVHSYSFTRTENQILKILEDAKKNKNSVILYTIVDTNLAKYLANLSNEKKIPCFGVLGNLILNFSKILNQEATHEPSGQYVLNEEYYKKIEAIQFTMNHDDGNMINDIEKSDIILIGENDWLVIDGGNTHFWSEIAINIAGAKGKKIGGILHPGTFSMLGVGVPFALSAKNTNPNSNVILISGDGKLGTTNHLHTKSQFN